MNATSRLSSLAPLTYTPTKGVVGADGSKLTGHLIGKNNDYAYVDLSARRALVTSQPFDESAEPREIAEREPTAVEQATISMSSAGTNRGKVVAKGEEIASVATDISCTRDGKSLIAAVDARFSHNEPRVYVFDYSNPRLPALPLVGVYDLAGHSGRLMSRIEDVIDRTGPVTHNDVREIEALLHRLPDAARYGVAMSIGRRLNAGARPITSDVQEHLAEVEQSLAP
jgi:hypothetical protein